jgi:hypothetical protein
MKVREAFSEETGGAGMPPNFYFFVAFFFGRLLLVFVNFGSSLFFHWFVVFPLPRFPITPQLSDSSR